MCDNLYPCKPYNSLWIIILYILCWINSSESWVLSPNINYHKPSNISRVKPETLNDPCLLLQLALPNQLKPGVKSRMKM